MEPGTLVGIAAALLGVANYDKAAPLVRWLAAKVKGIKPGTTTGATPAVTTDIDDLGHRMIAWFDAHGGDVRDEVRDLMRLATDLEFPPKDAK